MTTEDISELEVLLRHAHDCLSSARVVVAETKEPTEGDDYIAFKLGSTLATVEKLQRLCVNDTGKSFGLHPWELL